MAGREIGIFNLDGAFYALKNACAHQGARVCLGKIVGTALPSDVYEYQYGREGQILRCPWHEWEYDIKTGESVFDPKVSVRLSGRGGGRRRDRRARMNDRAQPGDRVRAD